MKRAFICCFLWLATLSLWAQYNPSNPPEPGAYYTLTLQATPSDGGSFNLGATTSQTGGNFVRLRANANSGFRFVAWAENGVILSQEEQYDYQMPARNVTLTAHFDYDPDEYPSEPTTPVVPVYSRVFVSCEPAQGGSFFGITSGERYEQGTSISLYAVPEYNFLLDYWTEDGEIISTSSSFKYVVKSHDTHLIAHFLFNPESPDEPPLIQPEHKLYISVNPANSGSFSPASGNSYVQGTAINLSAYENSNYAFSYWAENDSIIGTTTSLTYTMPNHDVAIQAHFTALPYNPESPDEPGIQDGERHNIFGRTENALRGETVYYPIWLENTTPVMNMYIDVTFPHGFVVDTAGAHLTNRAGNNWLEKIHVEGNTWRMRIRGNGVLIENNGPVMEIPVAIPEEAQVETNYLVALTHGVVMRPDSTQVPIGVRSGNIYVRRLFENELYASFSYDKYQTRVGFTNRSAGNIQSCEWDFGDGQHSSEFSPMHVYDEPGAYTVRLTIHGQSQPDMMETSIYLNPPETWKAEGGFSIDTTLVSARNFSSFEELVTTLLRADVTGDIVVNILHGMNLYYNMDANGLSNFVSLLNKVKQAGYTITFRQSGQGSAPSVTFGNSSQHSLIAMQQLWENLEALSWQSIETHLYGVWFDFAEWKALSKQLVSLGEQTKPIDFSRIAPTLSYTWHQTPKSTVVFGAPEQGSNVLPSMMLTNEGEGANDLLFAVSASRNGQPFCNFTHTITVAPALVGLFNDITPADHALLDVTAFSLSWNRILNAQYTLYLWDSINPPATQPILSNSDELHYATSGFCQFGHSYKWVVVAFNESQRVVSDTMSFSIRALPDLHVTSVHCTEAAAEGKMIVNWGVHNDGQGHTGSQRWKDRIWLVRDVYVGTAMDELNPVLLAEVENVKALDLNESYSQSAEVSLPEDIYGEVYIVVTSDMYNLQDIEWSAIGGSVPNPYQPSATGSGYRYLYAQTNARYNEVYEADETPTHSDNFFYTKVQLNMPPTPDLIITNVVAEPLELSEYKYSDGLPDYMAEFTPSPLTVTGLAYYKVWYSGKRVKVTATIVNNGSAPITDKRWRNGLWIANSADKNDADMIFISSRTVPVTTLTPGASMQVELYGDIPYAWEGNTYFHVMADIDEEIEEFANTVNNWGQTDVISVSRTPGPDFVPTEVQVPNRLLVGQEFTVKYSVQNRGAGIPAGVWKDKIWLSPSPDGIDDRAICLLSFSKSGIYSYVAGGTGMRGLIPAEYFHYEGDSYTVEKKITPDDMPEDIATGKYYVYVQVDAENKEYETEPGELNNIICSDSVWIYYPDIAVVSFSMSRDTLSTGEQVALTWKIKNVGEVDIVNAQISDNLYASIHQDGDRTILLATISNNITIPVGEEKTLRANVTIPKMEDLEGIMYVFMEVNHEGSIIESNLQNNRSSMIRTVCIYSDEEQMQSVSGPALALDDINVPAELYTDSAFTVIFRIINIGDRTIEQDVTTELFLSHSITYSSRNAIPMQIISVDGATSGLRPGASVMAAVRFRVPANVLGGDYIMHIVCDRTNAIRSKNTERNNAHKATYVYGQLPEPVISNVTLSDTVFTAQPATLRFEWSNKGTWKVDEFDTHIYLSKSASLERMDNSTILLSSISCSALNPNESKTYTYTLNLEDKKAGKWYLHLDPSWSNNGSFMTDSAKSYSKGIVVELSAVPDLVVSAVQAPASCLAGENITISFSVQNSSEVATRQSRWADDFWLSPSNKLDTKNATKLGARTHSGILTANGTYEASVSYLVPENLHGNYILYVRTDAADAIVESDEDNNYKAIPVYIRDANDRPSDLVITNLSVPDVIYAGEPVSITYTVTNQGEFEAEGVLRDILYLSEDNRWDTGDHMVGVISGNVHLRPGEQVTRTATGVISTAVSGSYYPILRTNSTRAIAERDYEINVRSASPSQLNFRTLTLGQEMQVNTSSFMSLTVQDNQSVMIRLSHPQGATAGLYVSSADVPSTARNEWHSAKLQTNKQEVVLSNLPAGTYYVLAQDNAVAMTADDYTFSLSGYSRPQGARMTIKAEVVDFGATSLNLTQGGNGGWVTTGINGALFDSVMDFRLISANRTLPAEMVSWDGGTQAVATFNLTEAETGVYHLVSERPDGLTGTLVNAFQVVEGRSFDLGLRLDMPNLFRMRSIFPFTFSYANGGTTDVELSEIRLVIDEGAIGLSVEDVQNNPQTTVVYRPNNDRNVRGYVTIPPGEQNIVNMYCAPGAQTITIYVYILK